jgi:hypothetical protein
MYTNVVLSALCWYQTQRTLRRQETQHQRDLIRSAPQHRINNSREVTSVCDGENHWYRMHPMVLSVVFMPPVNL